MIIRDAKVEDALEIKTLNNRPQRKAYKDLMPEEAFKQEIITDKRIKGWEERASSPHQRFLSNRR